MDLALTIQQYVDALNREPLTAVPVRPEETRHVAINGLAIRLCFLAKDAVSCLMPAFDHLECAPTEDLALSVTICDRDSLGSLLSQSPWRGEIEQCKDRILMVNGDAFHMQYNPDSTIYSVINTATNKSYYYANDFRELPHYEKSAPLKFLIHWWCEEHDMCLVHAAAVGFRGDGVLLVGKGGTGKSTTAVSSLAHGLDYAGDDYVVLSHEPAPHALSIYCSAKLNEDIVNKLPELHRYIANPERTASDKALLFLERNCDTPVVKKIRLKAILAPAISQGKGCLKRSPPVQVFADIASSTIFQMPGSGHKTLRALKGLFQQLPVYTFELDSDLAANAQMLKELCMRLHESE